MEISKFYIYPGEVKHKKKLLAQREILFA